MSGPDQLNTRGHINRILDLIEYICCIILYVWIAGELYSIYTQLNPKYDLYAPWYLADLGQTLRYLILNRDFEGIFKEDSSINKNLLEQSYDILRKTVEGIGDINPIGLSKQIIKN